MSGGADIGVGDWVECVDAQDFAHMLSVGSVYRCESISPSGEFIRLVGVGRYCPILGAPGFCRWRFRPIYRPKSELLESLLHKADEPVREEV